MKNSSLLAMALASGLAACSTATPTPAVGMANPASVYCAQLGGKTMIENRSGGQVGICHLPDGTQIEEWALFRRDHPSK